MRVTLHGPQNMDDLNSILSSTPRTKRRSELLSFLRFTIRNNTLVRLPNKLVLFKELNQILNDDAWQVRHECIHLISQAIPICGNELDSCIELVLVQLIRNLGHEKILVRRSTVHTLQMYVRQTGNIQRVIQAIVSYGLENEEPGISQEYTMFCLPMMLTSEFEGQNYFNLVQALARILVMSNDEKQHAAFIALQKVLLLVGRVRFDEYLSKLHPQMAREFERFGRNDSFVYDQKKIDCSSSGEGDVEDECDDDEENYDRVVDDDGGESSEQSPVFELGVIPALVFHKLNTLNNFQVRSEGVERLQQVMMSMTDISLVLPHLNNLVSLFNRLVSDVDFKIATQSLEVYRIFIERVKHRIRPHLHTILSALCKNLADGKNAVRGGCIRLIMQLMHYVTPMAVISWLIANLQNKSSKLREEIVNMITIALLTFPNYDFDLSMLCVGVTPLILDPKRKVRHSVLECLAYLAQALGPTRLAVLTETVEAIQRDHRSLPIIAAVHARLGRRILPRLDNDGLLQYSFHVPSCGGHRRPFVFSSRGADIDWVLAGAGSLSLVSASSRSTSTDREHSSGASKSSYRDSPQPTQKRKSPVRRSPHWDDNNELPARGRTMSDHNICAKVRSSPVEPHNKPTRSKGTNSSIPKFPDADSCVNGFLPTVTYNSFGKVTPDKPKTLAECAQSLVHTPRPRNLALGDVNPLTSNWPLQNCAAIPPLPRQRAKKAHRIPKQGRISENTPVPTRPALIRTSSAQKHIKASQIAPVETHSNGEKNQWLSQTLSSLSRSNFTKAGDALDSHIWDCRQDNVQTETSTCTKRNGNRRFHVPDEMPFNSKPVLLNSPSLSKFSSNSASSSNAKSLESDNVKGDGVIKKKGKWFKGSSYNGNSKMKKQGFLVGNGSPKVKHCDIFGEPSSELSKNNTELQDEEYPIQTYMTIPVNNDHVPNKTHREGAGKWLDRSRNKPESQPALRCAEETVADQPRKSGVFTNKKCCLLGKHKTVTIPCKKPASPLRSKSCKRQTVKSREPTIDPNSTLLRAIQQLNSPEWAFKCDGIKLVSQLAIFHPDILHSDLHSVTINILREVKNLRSSVSRCAISCFADLFVGLKRSMETQDLDSICKVLLHKSGESNKFIQDDVEKALMAMVEFISPQRAVTAVVLGGANHKNACVRKLTSHLLVVIVSKLGVNKLLTSKELTDKILPATAHFITDSSPFTRYNGRVIFHTLLFHPLFETVLQKSLHSNVIRNIRAILEAVKTKGIGEKPTVRI